MSEQSGQAAPGWYPDANAPGGQRWWDGTRWTEHTAVSTASAYQPVQAAKAPDGTKTGTVWIWLVALLPLLSIPAIFLIDVSGYVESSLANPGSPTAMASLFTPGYLIATVLGWGVTIATIVFGYLDWRALKARGVPTPFHWAFGFFVLAGAGIVYPIGRGVVVKRRTGGGFLPTVVAIVAYAIVIVASLVWTVVLMNQIFAAMPGYVTS
ncbi:MAG: DUF2510 domain-containing protein [Schumannella sp.]|nr:DUF2510 domain-containing protein [Microbacteriaceae bacterium]